MPLRVPTPKALLFPESRLPYLQIESWSNAVRTINIRGFTEHGLFSFDHITNGDRSKKVESWRLPALPIALQISPETGPVRRGECYVRATLLMGGFPVLRLISGYLTDGKVLTWPPGTHEHFTDGKGLIRAVVGDDPPPGSEIVIVVPENTVWLVKGVLFSLTTDATAVTRRVRLVIDDGATTITSIENTQTQGASITRNYRFIAGYPSEGTLTGTYISCFLPLDLRLEQGWRIRTDTVSLQAGDDFSAPIVWVEEWIEE